MQAAPTAELQEAVRTLLAAEPKCGAKTLVKRLSESHPCWVISCKEVRDAMQQVGADDAAAASSETSRQETRFEAARVSLSNTSKVRAAKRVQAAPEGECVFQEMIKSMAEGQALKERAQRQPKRPDSEVLPPLSQVCCVDECWCAAVAKGICQTFQAESWPAVAGEWQLVEAGGRRGACKGALNRTSPSRMAVRRTVRATPPLSAAISASKNVIAGALKLDQNLMGFVTFYTCPGRHYGQDPTGGVSRSSASHPILPAAALLSCTVAHLLTPTQ